MSKMSDISIEIQERLVDGEEPKAIARAMNIPLTWVYATVELLESQNYNEPDYEYQS